MKLLVDIGNSTVVVAIVNGEGDICHTWRFKTLKEESASFFRDELQNGLNKYQGKLTNQKRTAPMEITSAVISSVVPEVSDDLSQAVIDVLGITPHFFTIEDARKVISIDVESPSQLGKDRVADAIGAACCYGVPAIVFDMGTATTVGVVNEKKCFLGGMIMPGVKTSLKALSARASQLPSISIGQPQNIIGRNTLECMQSGTVFGTASMIDGIIDRIAPMFDTPVHIIVTGGMAKHIVPSCNHEMIMDEYLQFKGLNFACEGLDK